MQPRGTDHDSARLVARRLGALRRALTRGRAIGPLSLGPLAGLGGGFVAALLVDGALAEALGTPVRQLAAIGVFVTVAIPLWLVVEPVRLRRAREVVAWLNGWEVERWEREVGRRLPGIPRAYPGLLDRLPDTLGLRPLRVELLATHGRFGDARERLAALPADTPWQRFERAALTEYLAFCAGEPPELEPMRAALMSLADDERQLPARAMVALARARRSAMTGRDPSAELADLRPALEDRPRRYGFGQGTGVAITVVAMGIIAGVAVGVASAVLR